MHGLPESVDVPAESHAELITKLPLKCTGSVELVDVLGSPTVADELEAFVDEFDDVTAKAIAVMRASANGAHAHQRV